MIKPVFKVCLLTVVLFVLLMVPFTSMAVVLPGIDVLAGRNFDILQGKRVGLITNHTGRTLSGASTIDLIYTAPGVRLVALFSPEHGIRGDADEKVGSSVDRKTGVPIHSLYGKSCRPTGGMLKGVDVLVFDIQDIGTRFYTYIGTLSLAMRAARDAGIDFVVLDRPNPINGVTVSGAIPTRLLPEKKSGCGAITSIHPIPTRHGLTVGELARLFNAEFAIGCKLSVIPMQGWRREMYYDQSGLAWVNPSPNMKSVTAALFYPGPGTLETTNLSVARGTAYPFEQYGAPWVDSAAVVRNLNARRLAGVSFEVVSFVPTTPGFIHRGKNCHGVRLQITDRSKVDSALLGLHLLQAFHQVHPDRFKAYEGFATESGDGEAWGLLTAKRRTPEEVAARWADGEGRFRTLRERYLLY